MSKKKLALPGVDWREDPIAARIRLVARESGLEVAEFLNELLRVNEENARRRDYLRRLEAANGELQVEAELQRTKGRGAA